MGGLYIGGAQFYMYKIPERFFPGVFDIWVACADQVQQPHHLAHVRLRRGLRSPLHLVRSLHHPIADQMRPVTRPPSLNR